MSFTRILILDFETRWAKSACDWAPDSYSLSNITTEEYINSPLFKAFGVGYKYYGTEDSAVWISHSFLPTFFASIDWNTTAIACHNAQFDAAILHWIYGVKPRFIFDTLSMARALRGLEVGNSAAKLAEDFGLPAKGRALYSTDGMFEVDFEVEQELATYCKHDVFLCEEFLRRLMVGYPVKELKLIDMTIRMFTEPQLALDDSLLEGAIVEEETARTGLLTALNISDAELASNDKFADTLRAVGIEPPTKKSRTSGKDIYAFAKNDALFQQLLNGDNETAVLLCEARMKVKSTQERTRAQRFLDISRRGKGLLPVPISYAGTRTLRWAAAKGSNLNMQNLKRKGTLRKSVIAPPGYQCVAGDLSQIEPRVQAYLADFTELLDIFRSGEDVYALFGRTMFGIPDLTAETHGDLRQSSKSAVLGCFADDTQVLTDRGWVGIVQVDRCDRLWDGQEWVTHTGVIPQGLKQVFRCQGLGATSDHEILTEHGWAEWNEVRQSPSLFRSALLKGSLPFLTGGGCSYSATAALCTSPMSAVAADGKDLSLGPIYCAAGLHDATHAQKPSRSKQESRISSTPPSFQMRRTESEFSTECPLFLADAKTRNQKPTQTTGCAEFVCGKDGETTAPHLSNTLSLSMGGTSQNFSWTASTTTGDTSPGTFGSARAALTCLTSEKSLREMSKNSSENWNCWSEKTQTYDVSNAGPRNRFTVKTDAGPIVVHNCGYQLGWASFAGQLLVGFLGAPPTRYDKAFMKRLGIGKAALVNFIEGKAGAERLERLGEIPHTCTYEELLIHCVCAKEIIDRFRAASAPIVAFWAFLEKMIATVLADPEAAPVTYKCLTFMPGKIILPNGLPIRYDKIKVELDAKNRPRYSYWNGKTYKNLYAGVVAENVTSGTARCVIADGMLRVHKRYHIAMPVHDELVVVVPDEEVEEAKKWVKEQMTLDCPYLPGIPLGASVTAHRSYGLAK